MREAVQKPTVDCGQAWAWIARNDKACKTALSSGQPRRISSSPSSPRRPSPPPHCCAAADNSGLALIIWKTKGWTETPLRRLGRNSACPKAACPH
ncbi:hypothetical protein FH972_023198 [Carpinus fangiana]|uniref:Uncharacterized protein n=1 Tax=Carpinus fangiana TaxID=176857 RepID=A0A5N6KUR4_9ROSI|nr:hypothetical protein FH972_023198 [Carpinus fangiana]